MNRQKHYLLGVDGGGTKTTALILSSDGEIIGKGKTGSTDIFNTSPEEVNSNIYNAINEASKKAGIYLQKIDYAVFGLPAAEMTDNIDKKLEKIVKQITNTPFDIVNDVRTALEGAHPLGVGAIVLAGTGSMVLAKDQNNNVYRVDGWGENVGDQGSAYYIGRRALISIFESIDGRGRKTLIKDKVQKKMNITNFNELAIRCKGNNARKFIASFAEIVCEAAEEGDIAAQIILQMANNELQRSLLAVKFHVLKSILPVSTVGSVFKCPYLLKEFKKSIKENEQFFELKPAEFSPEIGAAIMAAKKILQPEKIEQLINKLKKTKKHIKRNQNKN
jgi:N-acetylglucosamine kinase-like BadF-type ATPase